MYMKKIQRPAVQILESALIQKTPTLYPTGSRRDQLVTRLLSTAQAAE